MNRENCRLLPDVYKRQGYDLEGVAKEAGGFLHLINSGAACLDANGEAKDENGNAVMKQWWDITEEDQKAIMDNTEWCMADNGYFRGGGYSSRYETRAQMPATMILSLIHISISRKRSSQLAAVLQLTLQRQSVSLH